MTAEPLGEPIVIRFDGLDADSHVIELTAFSESLRGLSRIIATSAHFAITQEYARQRSRQVVRVVVRPPRGACVIVDAIVQYSSQHPLIQTYASDVLSALTASVITFIVTNAANKKGEMKHLSTALETAIKALGDRDQPTVDRLLATVEKMADALAPAVKQAVAPVGLSARTLTVGVASAPDLRVVVDEADKASILSEANLRVDEERTYDVLISELDMVSGSCHVNLLGQADAVRHPAKVTDPLVTFPNNPYVTAMAAVQRLRVRAKATLREGEIDRLYISNYEDRPRGDPAFGLS